MVNIPKSRYFLFFHVVFVYIIASFIWWSYLLHKNNYQNYNEIIKREETIYLQSGRNITDFYSTAIYIRLHKDFKRTELMLYGEGVVFIGLITLGFWRMRKTFREEVALTRQQNNFLLSITHELKSPLASLKLSMQTIQKRQLDAEQVKTMADMSLDDIERLESLVENILLASKIESANFRLNKELIDLSSITKNIFDRIRIKFKGQRNFRSQIEDNVYFYGDRFSFSSVIYNLIENAIKYSGKGAEISVELRGDDKNIYLRITDTGIGIPEMEKGKIFGRFYRIGTEETRKTKGTGLGLFIVNQVVMMHSGKIEVKNNDPVGSIFEITIPVGTAA
ncbi:MAG: HAMP domain-containing histidine kinase [Chitinophagales bacterium]|jgi:two-component system phosphate regulon sensor histidine kinase PhoR|nr:HAMP domain-containing histidine kinase [Bacteroidota bacterium]MBK7567869.1 HAMP domain-containing histidine kinase [Bacteroidota bacterium]MBP8916254.1 HAMP domain-containing histidine kinase [Chitinophagales bacterium]MBP9221304.1 HAMP domain-containing histidine kinase [Chitinophagales bacterium]MBP9795559.1 HAMP domain-containing histidine kinase [Chitinophagales bacterium]